MNTKCEVLKLLLRNDGYVSGEFVSKRLGVTRAAINVAVNSLRADGYVISSSTKKGYHLDFAPDILNESIAAFCDLKGDLVHLKEVDSTNTYLKRYGMTLPSGSVVVAEKQTLGRGRLGKSFLSPESKGIYMSYLYHPKAGDDLKGLTARVALCVRRAIGKLCNVDPKIKWVNDILLNDKKICGILSEMSVEADTGNAERVVIGIGVNVNNDEFPEELKDIATSIKKETRKEWFRPKICGAIVEELNELFSDLSKDKRVEEYKSNCVTVNKEIKFEYNGVEKTGFAYDIKEDFSLLVKVDGEDITLSFGDVSVRGLYGYV
ncbi:MAG: biotin--[Clostridia bacterium]|nr:biotin--[acetyl-CoA-carboxylase] ligase [Clostridia bacterium]